MGIGRRAFLKLTGVALAGLTIDPLKAVAINEDAYVNRKLGILFYKPRGWGFVSVTDFGDIADKQIFGEGLGLSKQEIIDQIGTPICMATKYFKETPENKGIFSPTITLNITPEDELEDLASMPFEDIMEFSDYGTALLLNDFKVTRRYDPQYISNCKFFECDGEYLFEHIEIDKPLRVEIKVLRTRHNGLFYDFNCHQLKEQNQVADREFEYFKSTIKLI